MKHWLTIAGAALLAHPVAADDRAVVPPGGDPPATDGELSPVEKILLEIERNQRLTVPVTIMGEGPFRFMIDTGAEATVLSRALADQLQLHDRSTVTLVGTASTREVESTIVPDVTLGRRAFTVLRAPVIDGRNIGEADGILGVDSLQDQRVLFDFTKREIAVAPARQLGGDKGFDIVVRARRKKGQLIIHDALVDGVRTRVIIDTGAQGSVGNMALARKLKRAWLTEPASMTDINGVQTSGSVKIAERLSVGDAGINRVAITFTDSPTFDELGLGKRPAMILGMAELRLFKRVAIDFRTKRVLFEFPENVAVHQPNLVEQARQRNR